MITHDLRVMADAMLDKKAQNVIDIDLRPLGTAITDHFMICNADSTTNVNAIADNVIAKMREEGRKPLRTQGLENNFWIILDYGDIVAHISLQSTASSTGWRSFGPTLLTRSTRKGEFLKPKERDRCRITQTHRTAMSQERR